MKKCIMGALVLTIGLSSLVYLTSCKESGKDNTALLATLLGPKTVYLFQVTNSHNGDFGGREGLDTLAQTSYAINYAHLQCTEVHAFISVSSSDSILNLGIPENIPIKSQNGTVIANNLADLLDNYINVSMEDGGVTAVDYWTGSTGAGNYSSSSTVTNCAGWTSSSGGLNGIFGQHETVHAEWLYGGSSGGVCGATSYGLLGVCW